MKDGIIERIDLYKLRIMLTQPFVISLETITHAENIAIRIHSADGDVGWGECSPYRTIIGETPEGAFAVGKELAQLLLGQDARNTGILLDRMDARLYGNWCIKSAFDMAMYDLAARRAGLSLVNFLGGKKVEALRTDMTVGIADPESMAASATAFVKDGFDTIKVKLGQSYEADVPRIKAIREVVGNDISLRVDANQGWDLPTAKRMLSALADFGVEYCEAPISKRQSYLLPELRRQSPVAIMADESLFDHHDAEYLTHIKACDHFNIKLAKSGGIRNALRIVAIAERAGISSQVGCFSETRLGLSALAHFALANPNIRYHDMDSALMLAQDPVIGGIEYGKGGRIRVPEGLGHGATFDEKFLNQQESFIVGAT